MLALPIRIRLDGPCKLARSFLPHPVRAASPGGPPGRDGPLPLAQQPCGPLRGVAPLGVMRTAEPHGGAPGRTPRSDRAPSRCPSGKAPARRPSGMLCEGETAGTVCAKGDGVLEGLRALGASTFLQDAPRTLSAPNSTSSPFSPLPLSRTAEEGKGVRGTNDIRSYHRWPPDGGASHVSEPSRHIRGRKPARLRSGSLRRRM